MITNADHTNTKILQKNITKYYKNVVSLQLSETVNSMLAGITQLVSKPVYKLVCRVFYQCKQ